MSQKWPVTDFVQASTSAVKCFVSHRQVFKRWRKAGLGPWLAHAQKPYGTEFVPRTDQAPSGTDELLLLLLLLAASVNQNLHSPGTL